MMPVLDAANIVIKPTVSLPFLMGISQEMHEMITAETT
jgi:hypothetical protein